MNKTIAKEVLFEAKGIFDKLGIPFFLIYGTALGAVRDKGFIETDEDIDLGVFHEDLIPKIEDLRQEFEKAGFKVYGFSYPYPYCRALNIYKYDILIDIRNFEAWEDGRFLQRIDSNRYDIANVFSFKDVEPIEFLGEEFKVPKDVKGYLKENYGDWETPHPEMHFSYAGENGWWKKLGRETIINEESQNR
jgi:lipopolysaccharide cholinephosphotransferase